VLKTKTLACTDAQPVKRSLSLSSSISEPDHRKWNPCPLVHVCTRPHFQRGSPAAQIRQAGGPCRCLIQGKMEGAGVA
jgi:hypothetical protein